MWLHLFLKEAYLTHFNVWKYFCMNLQSNSHCSLWNLVYKFGFCVTQNLHKVSLNEHNFFVLITGYKIDATIAFFELSLFNLLSTLLKRVDLSCFQTAYSVTKTCRNEWRHQFDCFSMIQSRQMLFALVLIIPSSCVLWILMSWDCVLNETNLI